MLLGSNCPEPMGKGGLGIKAGDFALRRVEDDVGELRERWMRIKEGER